MRSTPLLLVLSAALLSGCLDTSDTPVMTEATTIAPTPADQVSPAYKACQSAIAAKTGRGVADVAIFDYLYSEAGTQVQATVAGADAPWRCLSSNSGVVAEVMYTGSEGAL